jgi:hypothetical protein
MHMKAPEYISNEHARSPWLLEARTGSGVGTTSAADLMVELTTARATQAGIVAWTRTICRSVCLHWRLVRKGKKWTDPLLQCPCQDLDAHDTD